MVFEKKEPISNILNYIKNNKYYTLIRMPKIYTEIPRVAFPPGLESTQGPFANPPVYATFSNAAQDENAPWIKIVRNKKKISTRNS